MREGIGGVLVVVEGIAPELVVTTAQGVAALAWWMERTAYSWACVCVAFDND